MQTWTFNSLESGKEPARPLFSSRSEAEASALAEDERELLREIRSAADPRFGAGSEEVVGRGEDGPTGVNSAGGEGGGLRALLFRGVSMAVTRTAVKFTTSFRRAARPRTRA